MAETTSQAGEQPNGTPLALVPRKVEPAYKVPGLRPGQPEGMRMSALWQGFKARWLLASVVGLLLGAVAAAVVWAEVPAKYTAVALVRVKGSEDKLLGTGDRNDVDRTAFQKTQPALVTSRRVLGEAVKSEKVKALDVVRAQPDPAGWLQGQIKAGFIEDSDTMYINMSGTDADALEICVNAALDAYIDAVEKEDRAGQQIKIDETRSTYLRVQENLRQQKDKFQRLLKTLKTADPVQLADMRKTATDNLTAHRRDTAQLQAELRKAQRVRDTIKAQLATADKGTLPEALVEEALDNDTLIQKQRAVVDAFRKLSAEVQAASLPGRAAVVQARQDVQRAEEELARMRAERRPELLGLVRKHLIADLNNQLRKAEEEVRVLQAQERDMATRDKELQGEVEKIGAPSFELELLRTEIDQNERLLKELGDRKQTDEVNSQGTNRRIMPFQRAETPKVKSATTQIQAMAFAGLGAFLCGAVAVSFWEQRKKKIVDPEQVVQDLDVRVIGTLPQLPRRQAGRAGADPVGERVLAEAVAYVRTVVLAQAQGKSCPVVMVTSAEPQEGKTMLAGHLALSIAQTGRRTLLVDGDMRRPALARLFEVPGHPGLAEVLRGEVEWHAALCPTTVPNLTILPAGACSAAALRRLAAEGAEGLLRGLRPSFDFILLDSGPLMAVSDGLLLGQQCDGLVMVVRPQHSRLPSVLSGLEQLRRLNIPLWGVVINGARADFRSTGYYHYYSQPVAEDAAAATNADGNGQA
jgi:capsular exopolysaccharide synthesis family protein